MADKYTPQVEFLVTDKGISSTTKKLGSLSAAMAGLQKQSGNVSAAMAGITPALAKQAANADRLAASTDRVSNATHKASLRTRNYALHIANTTIQSALVNKAFLALTDSMAKAVQQTDLIGNFPSVMGAMGIATDQSSEAMNKLRGYVQGVGGDLTAATSSVSRFAQINKDVKASVAMYAGVNNAIIAGGANAETAAASLEQLVQGYSRGRFEGEEFRSMQTSMNLALNETARALNLPNSQALQAALTEGEVSMNQFMAKLAEVSTGTGPVAQAAMAQMNGIGFAMTMLRNTITNSLTAIYQAVGRQNIAATFGFITQVIQVLASWVVTLINLLMTLFNFISGLFGGPQLKKVEGDTAKVAGNLGNAANNAGDVGKGLDGAGKSAKKLNKQLASFDKMNVLNEKEPAAGGGGGGGGAGGGAGGANMGELGNLDDIFNGLEGKLQKAGLAAKIFAGVLAGLAGLKFAQGIINQIDGIAQSYDKARRGLDRFKAALVGGMDESGEKVDGFAQKLARVPLIIGNGFKGIGKFLKTPLGALLTFITLTTTLYNTNKEFKKGFDAVWLPAIETLKEAGKIILGGVVWGLEKIVEGLIAIGLPLDWLLPKIKELAEMDMETLGQAFSGVALIIGGVLGVKLAWAITQFIILGTTAVVSAFRSGAAWVVETAKMLANIVAFVAQGILQFVRLGVAATAPAVKTAIAWAIQMAKVIAQFVATAVSAGVQSAITAGLWVAAALRPAVAWTIQMAKVIAQFVATAVSAGVQSAIVAGLWIGSAARSATAWVIQTGKVIAQFVVVAVSAGVQTGIIAGLWIGAAVRAGAAWVGQMARVAASMAVTAGQFLLHIARMAAGLAVQAVSMAASWMIAMGPIGWIIAAVAGLAILIIANWDTVKQWLATFWEWIQIAASWAWDGIKAVFSNVGGWFKNKFKEGWDNITNTFNNMGGWFGDRWTAVKGKLTEADTWLGNRFKQGWNNVKTAWNDAPTWFGTSWGEIKGKFSPAGDWFKDKFQGAWNNVKNAWKGAPGFFSTAWGEIKKVFSDPAGYFRGKFQSAWNAMTNIWGKVKGYFNNRWNDIKSSLSSDKAKTLGRNIVEGLWNGINNMVGWVKGKIQNFGSNVLQGLKDFFKIKSPSRVMRDEVGKMLGLGLADGLTDSTREAVSAAEDTANSVVNAFSGMYDSMGKLESDFNINGSVNTVIGSVDKIDTNDYTPHDSTVDWANKLINGSGSNDSRPIQVVVQIGEDQVADKIVDLINDKTQMSGRSVIRV